MSGRSSVTLKKVAQRAGVSMMTVSLALRDDASRSRVSEETRKRIMEAVEALDYRPNARARALRSGRTNVIGLYAGHGYINVRLPFFTEIVSGLQEGGEQFKKDLLLHGIFHGNTEKDIFNELADGRIDGLVVSMSGDNPLVERLIETGFPVVAVADAIPGIPSIVVDDSRGSRLLVDHLKTKDYRHVVYLATGLQAQSTLRRQAAFREAIADAQIALDEIELPDDPTQDEYLREFLIHPDRRKRRSAIVCWNDYSAYGVLATCRRFGVQIPEDVGVVGFDGCPTPFDNIWSLTTIRAPWSRVAFTAVSYLDILLKGGTVPEETVLPVELVPGHTT